MAQENFCTCRDYTCQLHPQNHHQGCDLCIKKNLQAGEIPSCFFRAVHDDLTQVEDFSFAGFADFLRLHRAPS